MFPLPTMCFILTCLGLRESPSALPSSSTKTARLFTQSPLTTPNNCRTSKRSSLHSKPKLFSLYERLIKILIHERPVQRTPELNGKHFYSLPALETETGLSGISCLPVSIRIVLESVLRNRDGKRINQEDVTALAEWNPTEPGNKEIPFVVSRVVLQDFTGVPLLVDLAAMRDAVQKIGGDPALIEPLVPVDLVVDHSVQVDRLARQVLFDKTYKSNLSAIVSAISSSNGVSRHLKLSALCPQLLESYTR